MFKRWFIAAGAALMALAPAALFAETTLTFTGTVTAVIEEEDEFEAPGSAAVGSAVTGVVTHASAAGEIYDPDPFDCERGYLFDEGTLVITIGGHYWDYGNLAVMVGDCVAGDTVDYIGQSANFFPYLAGAHQLLVKLSDRTAPFAIVDGLDLPAADGDLDFLEATRMVGRIVNFTGGEIRFDIDTIFLEGELPVDTSSWGDVKALFAR